MIVNAAAINWNNTAHGRQLQFMLQLWPHTKLPEEEAAIALVAGDT